LLSPLKLRWPPLLLLSLLVLKLPLLLHPRQKLRLPPLLPLKLPLVLFLLPLRRLKLRRQQLRWLFPQLPLRLLKLRPPPPQLLSLQMLKLRFLSRPLLLLPLLKLP
jgi:hypothetical protein